MGTRGYRSSNTYSENEFQQSDKQSLIEYCNGLYNRVKELEGAYVHICVYMCVYVSINILLCIHVYMCMPIYAHIFTYLCIWLDRNSIPVDTCISIEMCMIISIFIRCWQIKMGKHEYKHIYVNMNI
jgi:hypothetical protein